MANADAIKWLFDLDRADGGVAANQARADMPEYKRGDTVTIRFDFWDVSEGSAEAGFAFGGSHGGTFGGSYGGTFGGSTTVAGLTRDHLDRYRDVRQYLDYAGAATINRSIDGVPHVTERLPSKAEVSSIIVALQPGTAYTATPGFWGVVMDGDDPTRFADDLATLEIEFIVLAELEEYDSRSELKNDLSGATL